MIEMLFLMHLTTEVANRWEPYHLNPMQQQWFTDLHPRLPNGDRNDIGCCDVADGFPAEDWDRVSDPEGHPHYRVLLDGKWWGVPDEAVILDHGNPVGVPVVWLFGDKSGVRCFVPGPETMLRTGDRLLIVCPAAVRRQVERRLRAVSRAGKLAGWYGEYGR